jgi:DNA-binding IclR family transcriptional regulator
VGEISSCGTASFTAMETLMLTESIPAETDFSAHRPTGAQPRSPARPQSRGAAGERDNETPIRPVGARSVERTLQVLKELGGRGEFGWRLTDLAEQVHLDRGTCHRILACLVSAGFARRYPNDAKYYPGQLLFEMGLALPRYSRFRELASPRLDDLCYSTGCITSLSLRSGDELFCIAQQRGEVELSAMMIRVGTRRPLIGAVGGMAILECLAPDVVEGIVRRNAEHEMSQRGIRRIHGFEKMQEHTKELGFAFCAGFFAPGVFAMAVPVLDRYREPIAAITLTGRELTFDAVSIANYRRELAAAKAAIEGDLDKCFKAA